MLARLANRLRSSAAAFRRNQDGSIAIIMGVSSFFLVMVTGLAIDVGRVMHAERAMANALDAAALAAAKGMKVSGLSDAEVQDVALRYFEANMKGHGGQYANVHSFNVSINRGNNSVGIEIDSDVPTLFANVAGISKISVPKSSVAIFDSKDIEVGLQLDVTGSMCSPCTKIAALKDAVAGDGGLLDILLPDNGTSNSVRIGLAPFAAGVNAGDYAPAVSDGRAGVDGCVYERRDAALQATEAPPAGPGALKVRADLPGAARCPSDAKVVAITDDKGRLKNEINGWNRPTGSTAGHLGAAWAWHLVSPEWATTWGGTAPAPYNDGRTQKFVILMTDGTYNTFGGVNSGANTLRSKQAAQDTCSAMKAKGITVYTIGFQVPNGDKPGLRNCASSPSSFYDAADAETLRAAFRAIAEEINNLRLSS
jgi:hypothetical protein